MSTEQPSEEHLIKQAHSDREEFRLAAARAFAAVNAKERRQLRQVATKDRAPEMVLEFWEQELRSVLADLKKTEQGVSLWKSLSKNLLYEEGDARQLAQDLVDSRRANLLKEKIAAFYGRKSKKQAARLFRLLQSPETELDDLRQRYLLFILYREISQMQGVSVLDIHSSVLKRWKTLTTVRRERKQVTVSERARLASIAKRRAELHATFDGLLGEAITREWDLPIVIDLRMQYEKKVQALSEEDANNPVKRLALFDKITRTFRDEEVEKMAKSDPSRNNLVSARHFAEEIDALLLRIFDLSNVQKNRLLTLAKEERELAKEQKTIKNYQERRKRILIEEPALRRMKTA